jgi:ribosome-associated translation inhibitor RaiA
MQTSVQITFKGRPVSDAVRLAVRRHTDRLERYCHHIESCGVAITAPDRGGNPEGSYRVSVDLAVPGGEITARSDCPLGHGHEDVYAAIRSAFQIVLQRLEDYVLRVRDQVPAIRETRRAGGSRRSGGRAGADRPAIGRRV